MLDFIQRYSFLFHLMVYWLVAIIVITPLAILNKRLGWQREFKPTKVSKPLLIFAVAAICLFFGSLIYFFIHMLTIPIPPD